MNENIINSFLLSPMFLSLQAQMNMKPIFDNKHLDSITSSNSQTDTRSFNEPPNNKKINYSIPMMIDETLFNISGTILIWIILNW